MPDPAVPKPKKIETLLYVVAKFKAAVPGAWLAKLNVNVCHPPATVVVANVSTDNVGSPAFSTFNSTGVPASGDHTRTVIDVFPAENGITGTAKLASVDTVVPAQVSAPTPLTTRATRLAAFPGSATTVPSAPPNPVNTGAIASSKVITKPPDGGGGVTYACCALAADVLALPARSMKAPAATLTSSVPVASAGGFATSVACLASMRTKAPLVPPVRTTSSVVKLVPTSSLKTKLNVTSPVAVSAATLSVMVRVGGVVSTRRTWSSITEPAVEPAGSLNPYPQTWLRPRPSFGAPAGCTTLRVKSVNGTLTCFQPVKLSTNGASKRSAESGPW